MQRAAGPQVRGGIASLLNERGWAMLGASMALVVVLTLEGAFLSRTLTQARAARQMVEARNGYYLAEGLAELGIEWVRQAGLLNLGSLPRYGPNNPWGVVCLDDGNNDSDGNGNAVADEVPVPATLANYTSAALATQVTLTPAETLPTCSLLAQEYNPNYNGSNANPGNSFTGGTYVAGPVPNAFYVIAQVGTGPTGIQRQVKVLMQLQRLDEFAYFINGADDIPDPPNTDQADMPWFQSPTFISGPVHVNGFVFMAGEPVFELGTDLRGRPEKVTTSLQSFIYWYPGWKPSPNNALTGVGVWGATYNPGTPGGGIEPRNIDYNGNPITKDPQGNAVAAPYDYNKPLWQDPSDKHREPLFSTIPPRMEAATIKKPFPDPDKTFQLLFSEARANGLAFKGDATIQIDPAGDPAHPIYVINGWKYTGNGNAAASASGQRFAMPKNGLLCNDNGLAKLVIQESVVDGVMTVCSEGNIEVEGRISYAFDPRTDPNNNNHLLRDPANNDMLGVIARKNIIIPHEYYDQSTKQTITVDLTNPSTGRPELFGLYLALNDSVSYRQPFDVNQIPNDPNLGTLTLYGALIENLPAAMGVVDANGHHGYYLSSFFDRRLRDIPLPGVPLDGGVNILSVQYTPPITG